MASPETTTMFAPGYVPAADITRDRVATTNAAPKEFIFKQMREATRAPPKPRTLGDKCCSAFWCLVPDVVEEVGGATGRTALKATVTALSLLTTAAQLDPKKMRDEMKAVYKDVWPSDPQKYEYKDNIGRLPGRLTSREMIYCARLSLLAYLTKDVKYDEFFPEHREDELLNHVFDDANNEVHQIFLVNYVASLFDSTQSLENGEPNPRFGYAKGMADGLAAMNLELVFPFNVNENEGYVAKSKDFEKNGGDIIIAFQGTVDRADFITSFNGLLTPFEPLWDGNDAGKCACLQGSALSCCLGESKAQRKARRERKPWGQVHEGFYNAFLSVRDEIQTPLEILLKDTVPDKKPIRIVVTGHSLGGALATLCTAWLMQWFRIDFPGGLPENLRVLSITFGQPKVGNDDFVNAVDKDEWTTWSEDGKKHAKFKTYRIFTPIDPVVTTPPVSMHYRHCFAMGCMKAGQLYFLPQSMSNQVDTTSQGTFFAIS
jgi:hypothetical protein